MAGGQEKWYFTKEQLQNSPSRKCGLDADKELAYRQQAANLIQDMGQRLQVSQLCINTAIVYMHRFYAFHSFTQFHRNAIAAAALFLAAKVEEQPRKLEYVIKVAHVCLYRNDGSNNVLLPEHYQEQAQDLVFNENVLLQTLGFDVAIDHPHTHVVRTCHLVKAPKDLAQTSYFMASNSLHLTTMCLQYRPTVVACFCIHLASKWSNWAIPQSNEGRHWFSYVDRSVTSELLEKLTAEFLHIFDKCPSRLKRKMKTMTSTSGSSPHSGASSSGLANSPFDKKHGPSGSDDFDKSFDKDYERERRRAPMPGGYVPAGPVAPQPQKIDYTAYREKREREERERRQHAAAAQQQQPAARPAGCGGGGGGGGSRSHKAAPTPHKQPHKPHQPPHHAPSRHHRPPMPGQPPSSSTSTSSSSSSTTAPHPVQPEVRTRPPSLFSPETAPSASAAVTAAPRRHHPAPPHRHRPEARPLEKPPSPKKRPDPTAAIREMQLPPTLSPFSSPNAEVTSRQRLLSNSSAQQLVPVVKKIEDTSYDSAVVRDSRSVKTKVERKPEQVRPLNGIETDPTLVSNLLKESLAKPAPITVATEKKSPIIEVKKEPVIEPPPVVQVPVEIPVVNEETDHKHKKEKKKKEKHKHKDRDKSKEERKKHKKDKEREKKKEPSPPPVSEPNDGTLRMTIPRDKLATSPGLKIKIPKERLAAPPPPPSGLKIKISKEILEISRKRAGVPEPGPPQKMARQNGAHQKVGPALGNGHAGK